MEPMGRAPNRNRSKPMARRRPLPFPLLGSAAISWKAGKTVPVAYFQEILKHHAA